MISIEHPYALEIPYVAVLPVHPAQTPGEAYAFAVYHGNQFGWAVDANDAVSMLNRFAAVPA